jgi:hypothetical protein
MTREGRAREVEFPFHLKVFGPGPGTLWVESMSEEPEAPRFREHLHEMREALTGLSRDVKTDVADAPHVAREGTKNALARAAGVRRTPLREWSDPAPSESK